MKSGDGTIDNISKTVHVHPALSEVVSRAAITIWWIWLWNSLFVCYKVSCFFVKYFLILNARHCTSKFKFHQERKQVILRYVKSCGFGLNLEKHFLTLVLNNNCEIEN